MRCPHCDYQTGYAWTDNKFTVKEEFWELPVELKREEADGWKYVSLFACPSCKKTFID